MNPTDLTKNINRWAPEMPIMGVAGDKPMAEKHDGYAASSLATQVRESPSQAGHHLGRHRRRQSAGEPGRRRDLHQRLRQHRAAHPRATCRSRASSLRTSTPAPPTSRSTIIATTIGSPICSRPPITARRGSASPAISPPRAISTPCARITTIPNLLFVGTEFGLYVTLDGGKDWKKFMTGLPSVRGGRYSDPSARSRPDHRHARPLHLDRRRYHSAGADEADRRKPTWCCSIRARPFCGRTIRRRSATPRIASSRGRTRRAAPPSASGRNPILGKGKVEFLQNDKWSPAPWTSI